MAKVQASELRLGNLMYFNGDIDSISEISQCNDGYCELNGHFNFDADTIKPIPLKAKQLSMFGFERIRHKDGTQGVYSNGKMNLILSNSGNVYTMRNKLIPYVHTLQNHYYFTLLTGEELTFKK